MMGWRLVQVSVAPADLGEAVLERSVTGCGFSVRTSAVLPMAAVSCYSNGEHRLLAHGVTSRFCQTLGHALLLNRSEPIAQGNECIAFCRWCMMVATRWSTSLQMRRSQQGRSRRRRTVSLAVGSGVLVGVVIASPLLLAWA